MKRPTTSGQSQLIQQHILKSKQYYKIYELPAMKVTIIILGTCISQVSIAFLQGLKYHTKEPYSKIANFMSLKHLHLN